MSDQTGEEGETQQEGKLRMTGGELKVRICIVQQYPSTWWQLHTMNQMIKWSNEKTRAPITASLAVIYRMWHSKTIPFHCGCQCTKWKQTFPSCFHVPPLYSVQVVFYRGWEHCELLNSGHTVTLRLQMVGYCTSVSFPIVFTLTDWCINWSFLRSSMFNCVRLAAVLCWCAQVANCINQHNSVNQCIRWHRSKTF